MRVVITRPRLQADTLVRDLAAGNIDVMQEPMLDIVPRSGVTLDLTDVQAILLTSGNGARALAVASDRRDVPVFAVGVRTAAVASDLKFSSVHSADGAVGDLAALVGASLTPGAGRLVHAAGAERAGDLTGTLQARGFDVTTAVLYDAVPADRLSDGLVDALVGQTIDGIAFFSPRSASIFVRLAQGHGTQLRNIIAFCLSQAVADAAADLAWGQMITCARPTQSDMVTAIIAARARI